MSASDNPLGLDGFAFAEFTSPNPTLMAVQLVQLGFTAAAASPGRDMLCIGRAGSLSSSMP